MYAYHEKVPYTALLLAAGLATALPIRNDARVVEPSSVGVQYISPTTTPKLTSLMADHNATQVPSGTLSLDELISDSKYIFVGRVKNVNYDMVSENPDAASLRVRTVVFNLAYVFKNLNPAFNTELTLRQFAPLTAGITAGRQVLWFVGEPTTAGFQHTVEDRAGYFHVIPDPSDSRYLAAINLNSNRGLWSSEGPLWNEDLFPEKVTAEYLAKIHRPPIPPSRQEMILQRGRQGLSPGPKPLELFLAAIYARLSKLPHH